MAIARQARDCLQLFQEKLDSCVDGLSQAQDMEDYSYQFNLWTFNNCVFKPLRASMDWKLRNSPLLESAVLELLDVLKHDLTELADNDAAAEAVQFTLQSLLRLSRAIQRSGISERLVQSASYAEYDENDVKITNEFRIGAKRILEHRLKASVANEELRARLLDTICLRQHYFSSLAAQRAKKDLSQSSTESSLPTRKSIVNRRRLSDTSSISLTSIGSLHGDQQENLRQERSMTTTATAHTNVISKERFQNLTPRDEEHKVFQRPPQFQMVSPNAPLIQPRPFAIKTARDDLRFEIRIGAPKKTKLTPSAPPVPVHNPRQPDLAPLGPPGLVPLDQPLVNTLPSYLPSINSAAKLPHPPIVPIGIDQHECPYCFHVYPANEFDGEQWSHHVIRDLMPYLCVLDACRTPNTLFRSSKDWVAHMRNQHAESSWTCMDRSHDSVLSFNSLSEFTSHMRISHDGGFEESDLDDISHSCFKRQPRDPPLTECPLCPNKEKIDPSNLLEHVGDHLIDLSQISIANHGQHSNGQSNSLSSQLSIAGQNATSRSRVTGTAESSTSSVVDTDEDSEDDEDNRQLSLSLLSHEPFETEQEDWNCVFDVVSSQYDSSRDETIKRFSKAQSMTFLRLERNRWWMPAEDIGLVALEANLQHVLGVGAVVQAQDYQGLSGYEIRAKVQPSVEAIRSLRRLSRRWQEKTNQGLSPANLQLAASLPADKDELHSVEKTLPVQNLKDLEEAGPKQTPEAANNSESTESNPLLSRYRRTGGKSASVGFAGDDTISNTSGGYILLDDCCYLLLHEKTVEAHLERNGLANIAFLKLFVTSPSSEDLKELRKLVTENLLGTYKSVSLSKKSEVSTYDTLPSYDEATAKGTATKLLDRLSDVEDASLICNVSHTSTASYIRSSDSKILRSSTMRMNWFLLPAVGKELHPSIDANEHCTETCAIKPSASVYYVAQGGLRTGLIGSAPMQVRSQQGLTLEWYLRVDSACIKSREELSNDAGAWILTCDGNRLMAQVWGDAGGLLFITPIEDMFRDIKEVTGAVSIGLLQDVQSDKASDDSNGIDNDIKGGNTSARYRCVFEYCPSGYRYKDTVDALKRHLTTRHPQVFGPGPGGLYSDKQLQKIEEYVEKGRI